MLEANLNKAPMSFERLHGWHNALFEYSHSKIYKTKRAKFRDDEMSVVSGPSKNVQIHYEALPAERVEDEMRNFLNFINKNHENTYVKSALAHLWFVIIYPYEGGNGRMARGGLWRTIAWLVKALSHFLSPALFTQIKKIIMKF